MIERSDNCASCPHLDVERDARGWPKPGKPGYCKLRGVVVEELTETWCDNQPLRNILGFEAPVGPVWVGTLPMVNGGVPVVEDGAGEVCAECSGETPGPKHILWAKDEARHFFCSKEHYLHWARESDPLTLPATQPGAEDISEMRRLHHGLCAAEEGIRAGQAAPILQLAELIRFAGPAIYRYLVSAHLLPKTDPDRFWPDLFRGSPKETREHLNPKMLEIQLSLRDLLRDPPAGLAEDLGDRAYEYARVRWARMVVGELLGVREGPETPLEVTKRFQGRHRPLWKEGESHLPSNARRSFYVERNPDIRPALERFFGAIQAHD